MDGQNRNVLRREAIGSLLAAGVGVSNANAASPVTDAKLAAGADNGGMINASAHGALGDGLHDDWAALQAALNVGAREQRPVFLPNGAYRITKPLHFGPNAMLIGASSAMGFGCRIEPVGCPAIEIGGASTAFHCLLENVLIWPKGAAPDYVIAVQNSYTVTVRNVRIHEAQRDLKVAAILLRGAGGAPGEGISNNIVWENIVVRNDSWQPRLAVLAEPRCGSHRFIVPDLENYQTLLQWRGGQIDLVLPYTERAGRYGIDCDVDPKDDSAQLHTFGGAINTAKTAVGCAIRETTGEFQSFGTTWGSELSSGVYVYGKPKRPVAFYGWDRVGNQIHGSPGWGRAVMLNGTAFRESLDVDMELAAGANKTVSIQMPGVVPGEFVCRGTYSGRSAAISVHCYVDVPESVIVVVTNLGRTQERVVGRVLVMCEPA